MQSIAPRFPCVSGRPSGGDAQITDPAKVSYALAVRMLGEWTRVVRSNGYSIGPSAALLKCSTSDYGQTVKLVGPIKQTLHLRVKYKKCSISSVNPIHHDHRARRMNELLKTKHSWPPTGGELECQQECRLSTEY